MSGLPDKIKIPDGPEKLSVSSLVNFQLPPQRKSTGSRQTDSPSEVGRIPAKRRRSSHGLGLYGQAREFQTRIPADAGDDRFRGDGVGLFASVSAGSPPSLAHKHDSSFQPNADSLPAAHGHGCSNDGRLRPRTARMMAPRALSKRAAAEDEGPTRRPCAPRQHPKRRPTCMRRTSPRLHPKRDPVRARPTKTTAAPEPEPAPTVRPPAPAVPPKWYSRRGVHGGSKKNSGAAPAHAYAVNATTNDASTDDTDNDGSGATRLLMHAAQMQMAGLGSTLDSLQLVATVGHYRGKPESADKTFLHFCNFPIPVWDPRRFGSGMEMRTMVGPRAQISAWCPSLGSAVVLHGPKMPRLNVSSIPTPNRSTGAMAISIWVWIRPMGMIVRRAVGTRIHDFVAQYVS
ncbi:hypothetical protein FB451DRAFT_1180060 [Mycena latifolia]|nr:hypothetical protein FB451DRAFT_1180060 [Mycena latifolia]